MAIIRLDVICASCGELLTSKGDTPSLPIRVTCCDRCLQAHQNQILRNLVHSLLGVEVEDWFEAVAILKKAIEEKHDDQ